MSKLRWNISSRTTVSSPRQNMSKMRRKEGGAKLSHRTGDNKRPQHTKTKSKERKSIHPVSKVSESESSDEEYLYVKYQAKLSESWFKHWFKAALDTGATINVVDQETFAKMVKPDLKKTSIKAFAFDAKSPVRFVGRFEATIATRKRVAVATFYVTKKTTSSGNLISATTAQDLGPISKHLNTISNTNDKKLDTILNKHANVFQGLGKLKSEKVKLNIDKHQTPKAQLQRRIPYHIREKVKDALKDLEKQDIIERVPESHGGWRMTLLCTVQPTKIMTITKTSVLNGFQTEDYCTS